MKKIIIIISLMILTGCTEKIICTNNTETENLKIEEQLIITHKGNKIKNVENNVEYIIKDENIKESFNKTFETIKENYKNQYINYSEEINENTYKFNVNYSPNQLEEEILNKLNSSKNLETYKKKILEQGMKCE